MKRAADSMGRVRQHIDVSRGTADLDNVVGEPIRDAAERFENRWGDGRSHLHRECEKIREAIGKTMQGFTDTDNQAADSIGSGS